MATTEPLITGVDFVCVPADDFDASVRFYGETLGLPCIARYGDAPGAEFQAGNLTLAVMDPTAFGQSFSPNSMPIAFQVSDVAAARERLVVEHGSIVLGARRRLVLDEGAVFCVTGSSTPPCLSRRPSAAGSARPARKPRPRCGRSWTGTPRRCPGPTLRYAVERFDSDERAHSMTMGSARSDAEAGD